MADAPGCLDDPTIAGAGSCREAPNEHVRTGKGTSRSTRTSSNGPCAPAAVASLDEGEFVRRLRRGGVLIRPRFAAGRDDVVAGYSVALRPSGEDRPVWYGGGRLARDLTLPRLRKGWPDSPHTAQAAVDE
jgi:hypothetical protein